MHRARRRDVAFDAAVADRDRAVRERRDVGFVGDEHDGIAGLMQPLEERHDFMPVFESRLPVGSSASRMDGLLTRARAMATRCRCPPDSSFGRWLMRFDSSTLLERLSARSRRSLFATPA